MILNKSDYIISLVYALKEQQNIDQFFLEEEGEKTVKYTVTQLYGMSILLCLWSVSLLEFIRNQELSWYFIHKFSKPLKLPVDEN